MAVPRPLTTRSEILALHRDVLAPSFPPVELVDAEELWRDVEHGSLEALGAFDESDGEARLVSGVVGAWFPRERILLVLYLAIAPGHRGAGVGGALLAATLDAWTAAHDPLAIIAEVEHPDHHTASEAHGDPTARVRFYARHGGKALALPYFQPGDGPGAARVPALMLVVLRAADRSALPGAPLRAFLTDWLVACEGAVADDAATRRLLAAASGPDVALVGLDALDQLPVGTLAEAEASAPAAPSAPDGSR
ncbi:GNAT family N-acetyltransferase [Luteimicrobium sp. NPDC057192]|uniref:GNAT family N-acetyltransferase n=1 Tax=Luteimicrobium sp. NPDC057192 TaxID=3346042 RepID=UPI003627AE10